MSKVGFVSMDDIKATFKEMKIETTDEEFSKVSELLDKNKNGYLEYKEFEDVFNQQRIDDLAYPNKGYTTILPSSDKFASDKQMCVTQSNFSKSICKESDDFKLKSTNRFTATPYGIDTFTNFRSNSNVDYSKGMNSNIQFQKEEKASKQLRGEAAAQKKEIIIRRYQRK